MSGADQPREQLHEKKRLEGGRGRGRGRRRFEKIAIMSLLVKRAIRKMKKRTRMPLRPQELETIKGLHNATPALDTPQKILQLLRQLGQSVSNGELEEILGTTCFKIGSHMSLERLIRIMETLKRRHHDSVVPDTVEAFAALGGRKDRQGGVDVEILRGAVQAFELTIDIDAMIQEVDKDGSGLIEFGEFSAMFDNTSNSLTVESRSDDHTDDGNQNDIDANVIQSQRANWPYPSKVRSVPSFSQLLPGGNIDKNSCTTGAPERLSKHGRHAKNEHSESKSKTSEIVDLNVTRGSPSLQDFSHLQELLHNQVFASGAEQHQELPHGLQIKRQLDECDLRQHGGTNLSSIPQVESPHLIFPTSLSPIPFRKSTKKLHNTNKTTLSDFLNSSSPEPETIKRQVLSKNVTFIGLNKAPCVIASHATSVRLPLSDHSDYRQSDAGDTNIEKNSNLLSKKMARWEGKPRVATPAGRPFVNGKMHVAGTHSVILQRKKTLGSIPGFGKTVYSQLQTPQLSSSFVSSMEAAKRKGPLAVRSDDYTYVDFMASTPSFLPSPRQLKHIKDRYEYIYAASKATESRTSLSRMAAGHLSSIAQFALREMDPPQRSDSRDLPKLMPWERQGVQRYDITQYESDSEPASPRAFEAVSEETSNIAEEPIYEEGNKEQAALTAKFLEIWNDSEGPDARIKRLTHTQGILSVTQVVMCCVLFVFAGLDTRNDSSGEFVFTNIFCGIIGFLSGILGVYAAVTTSEFTVRLFFICQMWVLNSATLYLYIGIDKEQTQLKLCSPVVTDAGYSSGCSARLSEAQAKVAFAVISGFVSVATACVALDLNDAINDYEALRPMLAANQAASVLINSKHPNHLVHDKPKDRKTRKSWHLRFRAAKTAPDIERSFFNVSKNTAKDNFVSE